MVLGFNSCSIDHSSGIGDKTRHGTANVPKQDEVNRVVESGFFIILVDFEDLFNRSRDD